MLAEYLRKRNTGDMVWSNVIPGVQICYFAVDDSADASQVCCPLELEPFHFETLFCLKGELILEPSSDRHLTLRAQDVILLSNCSPLAHVKMNAALEGILVVVDLRMTQEYLRTMCGSWGNLRWDVQKVECRMAEYEGCMPLRNSVWSQAVFATLEYLSRVEQKHYCVWKVAELLYLLCECDWPLSPEPRCVPVNEGMERRVREMCAYMEQHLHEKLTIEAVCRQFYLSPTSFKKYFRCIYGQPVHRWLQQRRMEKAADQLRCSDLTVLQIAQGVGYDGTSQFNATFKKFFGCTPKQYRNASESVDLQPIPQDRKV